MNGDVLPRLFLTILVLQSCQSCKRGSRIPRSLIYAPTSICSFGARKLQELKYFSVHNLGCLKIGNEILYPLQLIFLVYVWLDDEHIKHADNLDCDLFSMHSNDKCWSNPDEDSRLACAKLGEEDFISRISDLPAGICSCREADLASDYVISVLILFNCDSELQK